MKTLSLILLLAVGASAESRFQRVWYRASQAAIVVASALDAGSSVGKVELNPALQTRSGQFGPRSMGIKFGEVGALLITETLLTRHHPQRQAAFGAVNFAAAGLFAGQSAHNLGVARVR